MPTIPTFEDSNAYLIMKSVESIPLVDTVSQHITKEDNIVLVSMETDKTQNHAIPAMIEDVFIRSLLGNGYNILERDDNMLFRLMSESSDSFIYYDRYRQYAQQSHSSQSAHMTIGSSFTFDRRDLTQYEVESTVRSTSLLAADKILSYRILEAGIIYERLWNYSKQDSLRRIADTRILLRTTDAKTGEILALSQLTGIASDVIASNIREILEGYHMRFYRFGYPMTYGQSLQTVYDIDIKQKEQISNAGKAFVGVFSAAAIAIVIVSAAAQ